MRRNYEHKRREQVFGEIFEVNVSDLVFKIIKKIHDALIPILYHSMVVKRIQLAGVETFSLLKSKLEKTNRTTHIKFDAMSL